MLLSPPTLILLEASRSTWKSADPVQMPMEGISRGGGECVVAVEAMKAVLEVARAGVVEVTTEREAVGRLRLHDPPVKHPKLQSLSIYQTQESLSTSLSFQLPVDST